MLVVTGCPAFAGHDNSGVGAYWFRTAKRLLVCRKMLWGAGDAAFPLFDFHLWRQRCADWRLVGSAEMVRGRGRRHHCAACRGEGRDLTADQSGAMMRLDRGAGEATKILGQEGE